VSYLKKKEAGLSWLIPPIVGAASHLGANLAFKGLRGAGAAARSGAGSKLTRSLGRKFNVHQSQGVRKGIESTLSGKGKDLAQSLGETWLAPEFSGGRHVGAWVGESLRNLPKGRRVKVLKKIRKRLAQNPEFTQNTPWAPDLIAGINRTLERVPARASKGQGPLTAAELKAVGRRPPRVHKNPLIKGPKQPRAGKSALHNMVNTAIGGASAVIEPGALGHMAANRGRLALAKSRLGQKFTQAQFEEGFRRQQKYPSAISKPKRAVNTLTDYVVSPAARDESLISENLSRLAQRNPRGAQKLVGAFDQLLTGGRESKELALKVKGSGGKFSKNLKHVITHEGPASFSARTAKHLRDVATGHLLRGKPIPIPKRHKGTAETVSRVLRTHPNPKVRVGQSLFEAQQTSPIVPLSKVPEAQQLTSFMPTLPKQNQASFLSKFFRRKPRGPGGPSGV